VIVRTVLGDVEAADLGVTYAHEHVVFDSPFIAENLPDILLDDDAAAVAELRGCAEVGVGAMVDAAPCASGRHPERLAAISKASGVHIIAATGLHTEMWYPDAPWTRESSPDVLAALFTADISEGIDRHDHRGAAVERTEIRAGIIKIGSLHEIPNDRDRRVFEAAAQTAAATGAAILTHCEGGRGGLAHVELFAGFGVAPDRVILSHTDKVAEAGYHRDLLETGVNVEYDQALRQSPSSRDGTAWLVGTMVDAGFVDQIMLGTDGARRAMWTALGGSPGLAWLAGGFTGSLVARGVDPAAIDTMLVDNPARVLPLRP
jgi:predicted metal-dependent phosphotriesterase family hydrolase